MRSASCLRRYTGTIWRRVRPMIPRDIPGRCKNWALLLLIGLGQVLGCAAEPPKEVASARHGLTTDGDLTVTTTDTVVNLYAQLGVDASKGDDVVTIFPDTEPAPF